MKSQSFNFKSLWIFHSQGSGCYSLVSHWIIIIVMSLVISFIANIMYEFINTVPVLNEYHDWINSPVPKLNNSIKDIDKFDETLTSLVDYIKDDIPKNDTPCLFPPSSTEELSASGTGTMFGDSNSISVYPFCTIYLPTKNNTELTEREHKVFSDFSNWMSKNLNLVKNKDYKNIEEDIAKIFGLDKLNNNLSFVIPWIYVARKDGGIAIAPGSSSIKPEKWDITDRPWYKASFNSILKLAERTGIKDDKLSLFYLDQIGEKNHMYVRTYLRKFDVAGEPFVVGIDITLSESKFSDSGNYIDWLNKNSYFIKPSLTHMTFFIIAIFSFWMLRRWSSFFNVYYTYDNSLRIYGNLKADVHIGNTHLIINETSEGRYLGIASKFFQYIFKYNKTNRISGDNGFQVNKSYCGLRGLEEWYVYKDTYLTWRSFSLKFEHIDREHIGTLIREFNSAVQPEVDWKGFNANNFSENEVIYIKEPLRIILKSHPESYTKDTFKIGCDIKDISKVCNIPFIPDWVNSLSTNITENLSPQYCRAYLTIKTEQLRDFYASHDVKALISSGYLNRLLLRGETDFITRGRTINRLVSFGDASSKLILSDTAKILFDSIVQESSSSRQLRRLDIVSEEKELLPLYDFAIMNDKYIIVTHSVDETILVDNITGKHKENNIQVSCYVSWRQSDIEYFKDLFDKFDGKATNFDKNDVLIQTLPDEVS